MSKRFEGGLQILVLASAAVLAALWPFDRPATGSQEPAALPAQAAPAVPEVQPAPPAPEPPAVEMENPDAGSPARGRVAYRLYCASCHGNAGQGDGSVARYLKSAPTDLTKLAHANKGRFPADRVYASIDGRNPVAGHGGADMPVWGLSFQDPGKDTNQEPMVRQKIRDLVAFIEAIQAEQGSK